MSELVTVIAVALPCITAFLGFKLWLDRMHPQRQPDPSGAELLAALEEHKKEVKQELDAMNGRITFASKPQLRR